MELDIYDLRIRISEEIHRTKSGAYIERIKFKNQTRQPIKS